MKNSSLDRLAVYIDYQNAYRGARQAFGSESDHHTVGQFDPMRVAKAIAQRKPNYPGAKLRTLVEVRIYRGLPGSTRDPRGYAAARKQTASWRGAIGPNGLRADILLRPIAYGAGGPRERGSTCNSPWTSHSPRPTCSMLWCCSRATPTCSQRWSEHLVRAWRARRQSGAGACPRRTTSNGSTVSTIETMGNDPFDYTRS